MSGQNKQNSIREPGTSSRKDIDGTIFDDPEARRNIVGLFDLLLKIDRRLKERDEVKELAAKKILQP